jgi:glyoxylase-like metal-dependent hydrolase (beta-lactamase superfamily II)
MFNIFSLKMGELLIPEEGGLLFDPVFVWLITDGKVRVLVDTGMPDITEVNRRLKVDGAGGGHSGLRSALAGVNVAPEQIDYIITTHLHFDHAYNIDLFEKARVFVQRDELAHAADPVPTHRPFYFKQSLIHLMGRRRPAALQVVDGDFELLPGIQVTKTPGHTPGMHIPIVQTEKGKVALVSDLGDHYKNWYPSDSRATNHPLNYLSDTVLPGPLRSESEMTFVKSMLRVKQAADIIVPSHDTRIPLEIPKQWYVLPDAPEPPLRPRRPSENEPRGGT